MAQKPIFLEAPLLGPRTYAASIDIDDLLTDVHPAIEHSILGVFAQCLFKCLDTSARGPCRIHASELDRALPPLLRDFALELGHGEQAHDFASMGLLIRKHRE